MCENIDPMDPTQILLRGAKELARLTDIPYLALFPLRYFPIARTPEQIRLIGTAAGFTARKIQEAPLTLPREWFVEGHVFALRSAFGLENGFPPLYADEFITLKEMNPDKALKKLNEVCEIHYTASEYRASPMSQFIMRKPRKPRKI